MKTKSLGFIGGGRITRIFLQAFQNRQIEFDEITVCDTNENVLTSLKNQFPNIETCLSAELPARKEMVFIALHPPVIMETLEAIKGVIRSGAVVVSLAPKITLEKLSAKLGVANVARMIPNATSFINEGYNPVCFSATIEPSAKDELLNVVQALGKNFEVDERKLESYALVSAMLPTYFWFQWNELQEIGKEMGLDETETKEALAETLQAANHLFFNSGMSTSDVIDLIPVKPIAEHEDEIRQCFRNKLLPLFEKIRP